MADLTKYAKGKRMVNEDEIKLIEQNTKDIEEIGELLAITPTVYYTDDITNLTNDFINELQPGDIVIKQTGSGVQKQNHAYRVSFMKHNKGMCLTYTDASCSETVSYDKVALNWHYNSTDVTTFSDLKVEAITPTGTEEALQGLKIGNTSYKVGGGDEIHLYLHNVYIKNSNQGDRLALQIFNTSPNDLTFQNVNDYLSTITGEAYNHYIAQGKTGNNLSIYSIYFSGTPKTIQAETITGTNISGWNAIEFQTCIQIF
jgi:hypothetical protein